MINKLITGDVWKEAFKYYKPSQKKIACIAYVHNCGIVLEKDDILICDASDESIKWDKTSAKILMEYFRKGVIIYSHRFLHAKLLYTETMLILGSANLSNRSAGTLVESAIVTDNLQLLGNAKLFCNEVRRQAQSVTHQEILRKLTIPVIRSNPGRRSAYKDKISLSGDACWFMPLTQMPEKKEKQLWNESKEDLNVITKTHKLSLDSLGIIQISSKKKYAQKIKKGDLVVSRFSNIRKNRFWMYGPVTILEKKKEQKWTKLYYDTTEEHCLSWSAFARKTRGDKAVAGLKTFTKTITFAQAQKIKGLVLQQ